MSFYRAIDTPVLDFWRCVLWVSYPEWAALFVLDRGVCDIHCLRFSSGATPTDLLTASMVASHSSPICVTGLLTEFHRTVKLRRWMAQFV